MKNFYKTVTAVVVCLSWCTLAHAQDCPQHLLFSIGNHYYYSSINCSTSQPGPTLIYGAIVETGCSANGGCLAGLPLVSLTDGGGAVIVGNPPVFSAQPDGTPETSTDVASRANAKTARATKTTARATKRRAAPSAPAYRAIPSNANLMVPFGTPQRFSPFQGYPKYVKATPPEGIEGEPMYFIVYKMMIGGEAKAFGAEVDRIPDGQPTLEYAGISSKYYSDRIMSLKVKDEFSQFEVDALYEEERETDAKEGEQKGRDPNAAPISIELK